MRLTKLFTLTTGSLLAIATTVGCGDGGTTGSAGSAGTAGTGGSAGTAGTGGSAGTSAAPCEPSCDANKGVASECIAITENKGKTTFGLRMSQLSIKTPAALASIVISTLIDSGVTMNLPECNLTGDGTFSWILEFNTTDGTLKTGGAKTQSDPTAGYCFVNEMLGNPAKTVAPIVVDAKPDASGKFSVSVGKDVIVPIFLPPDGTDYVLLPLRNAKLTNGTVSADQNCIGKYNADKLLTADSCEPSGDVTRFTNAASVDAFITLEDADTVDVMSAGLSLCALLTGENDGAMPIKHCKRDAAMKITSKGDWCSTTDKAADAMCADAYKLGADFAASAVTVTGDCK